MEHPLYMLNNVSKVVEGPSEKIQILKSVNLKIEQGDSLAILGASGCGKSTLLHILAGLDCASSGEVLMFGQDLSAFTKEQNAHIRNNDVGFVFQFHHLLPEFNTVENVAMKAIIAGKNKTKAIEEARGILNLVGLSHREKNLVSTLSGGERQRAAIARAILSTPKVLLADEPTGNLDEENGEHIVELLMKLNHEKGMALVMVTHNNEIASKMGRIYELRAGELYD